MMFPYLNICLSSDDNYAQHLGVTIVSLIKAHPEQRLNIYVLDSGISLENKEKILSLCHELVKIEFKSIDVNLFQNIKISSKSYFTSAIFNRFHIPEIFSQLDRILYLDVDIVVMQNLTSFYTMDLTGYALGMVRDWNENGVKKSINVQSYYNSGVMLFDIKQCLEEGLFNRLIQGMKEVTIPLKLPDQDIINMTCQDIIKPVDFIYNAQVFPTLSDNVSFIKDKFHEICVLHYTSAQKPWKSIAHPFEKYYLDCLSLSPWKNEVKKIKRDKLKHRILRSIFRIEKIDRNKILRIFNIPICKQIKTTDKRKFYLFGLPIFHLKYKGKK